MIACLRLFSALCLAALLAACASSPSSSLGELPRTPDASIEQLLEQASSSKTPDQAALLRLSAADLAYRQKDNGRASQILAQVQLDQLKPAQQVFASTLAAELAMSRNQPKAALAALSHPSLEHLGELPVDHPRSRRPDPGCRARTHFHCTAAQWRRRPCQPRGDLGTDSRPPCQPTSCNRPATTTSAAGSAWP